MTVSRRSFAVVIGINAYLSENGIKPLDTAVNDARAIATLLREKYEYQQIWELFDQQASYEGITTLLGKVLPQTVGQDDRLLFYFAGHGIRGKGKDGSPAGYLIPQDAKINLQTTEPDQSGNFLPMPDLYKAFKAIDCHHLLVILDCCYAGMFRWATRKLIPFPKRIHREHYDRFIRFPAWQVLASAAHDQEALDLDLVTDQRGVIPGTNHSPFAMALLKRLGHADEKPNADRMDDGVITTPELYLYVDQYVNQWTNEQQTPGFWSLRSEYDRGEFIFTMPGFDPNKSLTPAPPLDASNNPYRGLESFEEHHDPFFFGREALIEDLYENRLAQPDRSLTIVLGASGSGKSSLVKAGLIPYLKKKQSQQWKILEPMRPGGSPFTALARILLPITHPELVPQLEQLQGLDQIFQLPSESETEVNRTQQSPQSHTGIKPNAALIQLATAWRSATSETKLLLVIDYFEELRNRYPAQELVELRTAIQGAVKQLTQNLQNDRQYLSQVIAIWSQTQPNTKLLLVIDQFEELITMAQEHQNSQQTEKEWQPFLAMLKIALASQPQRFHAVLTLRSDFEPRFLESELKQDWSEARFPVRAMNTDELRQSIEGPALKQALYFEPPDLVGRLIDEVGQMPGALPLLSFTLSELYIKLVQRLQGSDSTERALKLEDYMDLGGVAGSLTRRATEEYEQIGKDTGLGEAGQRTMQRVMLRMVTIEGGGVARRRVPESELMYSTDAENERVQLVIDRLVKARLLVKGQEIGESYVETAHDFLVYGWNNLQEWIENNLEDVILQHRLRLAAVDWEKGTGNLWIEEVNRLAQLEKVLESKTNNWLNKLEMDFAKQSIQERQDRIKKLEEDLRISEQRRARAEIREKVIRVENLIQVQPLDALILAIEAIGQNLRELPEEIFSSAQASLHKSIELAREQNVLKPSQSKKKSLNAILSPSGQRIVAFRDAYILQWSTKGDLICELYVHENPQVNNLNVTAVTLNENGNLIISGDNTGTIKVWKSSGQQIYSFKKHQTGISALAFDPVNQIIISGDVNGHIGLWKLNGDPICELIQTVMQKVNSISISSDSQSFVSGGEDCTVRLWASKGKLIHTFEKHSHPVDHVAFSVDDKQVLSCDRNGELRLWNQTGNLLQSLFCEDNDLAKISIDLQQKTIIRHTPENKKAELFDFEGRLISQFLTPTRFVEWLASFQIYSNEFVCLTGEHGLLRLCDLQSHQKSQPFRKHVGRISSVASSPDYGYIISAEQTNWADKETQEETRVCLWNTTGELIKVLKHKSDVSAVTFSRDGEYFASFDGSIWLWNRQGELIKDFPRLVENMVVREAAIAFSPDNQRNIVCAYTLKDKVIVTTWNDEGSLTTEAQTKYESEGIYPLVISSNGQQILIGGHVLEIIDQQANQIVEFRGGHRNSNSTITAVTFSPDGLHIATGSSNHSIQLWSTAQGNPIGNSFIGHETLISAITFSPDGKYIASGDGNGVIRLWDLDGNSIGEFHGHEKEKAVSALSFSPDGRTLISGGNDGTIRLWRADWKEWLALGCNRLRHHPVFRNPQTDMAKAAYETCQKYIWSKSEERLD